tara:strand:+ start:430 stop:633 length:204 start_codon:yes stop_codon:yes gene_type:complete
MNYLQYLKRNKLHYLKRWIVKYHDKKETKVREVKLIFNPDEYRKGKRARKLHTQKGLIKILERCLQL